MNRRELVRVIAEQTETDNRTVDTVLRSFTEVVTATMSKGDPVTLPGFAKFAQVKRAARTGRNPQTGEPIKIKASVKARITPLKALKDVVAGGAPAPKLAKSAGTAATATKRATKAAGTTAKATTASRATKATKATKAPTKAAAAKATTRATKATKAPAKAAPTKRAAKKA
jgi:DNA-binding protein HU-beta